MRHNLFVSVFSGHLANAATELMKLDHEEPQLTEPYLSKQKKLMVSGLLTLSSRKMYSLMILSFIDRQKS